MITKFTRFLMLVALVLCGAGCQSQVGVGDGPKFSENDTFLLEVNSFAHYRNDYFDRYQTPKDFHVYLTKSGSYLFRKEYNIVGWDVSWEIHWVSATDVIIRVFDFGAEFDHRSAIQSGNVQRPLGEISLHVDAETGKVSEHSSAT